MYREALVRVCVCVCDKGYHVKTEKIVTVILA
jgi:hypothetical protein